MDFNSAKILVETSNKSKKLFLQMSHKCNEANTLEKKIINIKVNFILLINAFYL